MEKKGDSPTCIFFFFLQFFADYGWNFTFSFVFTDFSFSYINDIPNSQCFIYFETFSFDLFDHNSAVILSTQMAFRGVKKENY